MVDFPRLYLVRHGDGVLFRESDLLLHELIEEVEGILPGAEVEDVTDMRALEFMQLLCFLRKDGQDVSFHIIKDKLKKGKKQ